MTVLKIYLLIIINIISFSICLFALPDSLYYPINLGNEWNYLNNSYTEKIRDTTRINGTLYFSIEKNIPGPNYLIRENNNRIYVFNPYDSTDYKLYDFTADSGSSWNLPSTFNYSYGKKIILVSKKDTVKTLAGVFYNCINFRQEQFCGDSGICNTWFAKGVGKIKFITKENNEIKENRLDNYYIDTLAKYDYFKYREFKLIQKYPTPFCPTTDIKYSLKSSSYVTLKIYDIKGYEIATIVNAYQDSGAHSAKLDFKNVDKLPGGVYFYKLTAGDITEIKKFVLVK